MKLQRYRQAASNLYAVVVEPHEILVEIHARSRNWEPIVLSRRDDSVVPAGKKAEWVGLRGDHAIALVSTRNPAQVELTVQPPLAGRTAYHFRGQLQSWERGVAAGTLTRAGGRGTTFGAVLVRERSAPR